jgi:hypothetical protein
MKKFYLYVDGKYVQPLWGDSPGEALKNAADRGTLNRYLSDRVSNIVLAEADAVFAGYKTKDGKIEVGI